jgi:hypothetical protein
MKRSTFVVLVGAFFLSPFVTEAGPIMRTGETVSVESAQELKGDFYGLGSKVLISGAAEDDVYVAGETVTINAPIKKDLTVIGVSVGVHGDIGDDVRVVGGDVTIAKPVSGDVVVLGGRLTILSTASVEGDVLFMGEELVIDGPVVGTVHGEAESARINADIGGDVILSAYQTLTVGGDSHIHGLVSYKSSLDMVRAQDAIIDGEIIKEATSGARSYAEDFKEYLLKILVIAFGTVSLYLLFRNQVSTIVPQSVSRFGFFGLVGLAVILTVPFISVVLFVSVIGSLVGAVLLFSFLTALFSACILAPLAIGYCAERVVYKNADVSVRTMGFALVVLIVMGIIPFSIMLIPIVSVVVLGAMSVSLYEAVRVE